MCVASSRPSPTPASAPSQPMTAPCVRKTRATAPGSSPSVRRIAMSRRLSLTTMYRLATMLKAATATISSRMSVIIVFSMRIAWK